MLLPPLVQIQKNPELHDLVQRDNSNWPRCLLWHGWLPALDLLGNWAETAEDLTRNKLEGVYGAYSGDVLLEWVLSRRAEEEFIASHVPQFPNVWTDGSLVADELTGIASAGAGVVAHVSGSCGFHRRWEHLYMLPNDDELSVESCSLYSSLLGSLQTAQWAEFFFWEGGVILALQAMAPTHLGRGGDNLNVVRHLSLSYSLGCFG